MANTLGNLIGPLYQALDTVSREFVGFIPAVTRDNGNFSRAAVGQTVISFTTPTVSMSDIVPGVTAPNDGDQVLSSISLQLNRAKRVPIRWNGEETLALDNAGPGVGPIMMNQMQQAFRTLTNGIEADLAGVAYQNSSRAYGTPGTSPFGIASDLSDFAASARILDDNGAPMGTRQFTISGSSMQNIRGKQSVLFKANEAGTTELLRNGTVGAVEGFALHYSPQTPTVTAGTAAGFVSTGAGTLGQTLIPVSGGTGTINPGDVVTFAGDARKYVVNQVNGTTTAGQTPTSITLGSPGLRQAIAANASITVGASYTPNMAFTSDALLLATRMPALPMRLDGTRGDMAQDRATIVDPYSGIAFDVSVYEQYKQIHLEIGLVWGVAAIKAEHIATLLG